MRLAYTKAWPFFWLAALAGCHQGTAQSAGPLEAGAAAGGGGAVVGRSAGDGARVAGASAAGSGGSGASTTAAGAGAAGTASQQPNAPDEPPAVPLAYELTKLSTCEDAERLLRDAALAEMNAQLDQNLANYLRLGGECPVLAGSVDDAAEGASAPAPTAASGTNNQVASVDEADFVKNDGHYIYRVGHGALIVLEAWPAANTREVGRAAIDNTPVKLFVQGDRAVVYVSVPRKADASTQVPSQGFIPTPTSCTYGYGCKFDGDGNDTAILLFDLTDRSAPKLLRRFDINSSLIAARRIDNTVHTVVAKLGAVFGVTLQPAALRTCASLTEDDKKNATAAFEKLRKQNTELIESKPLVDVLPTLREAGVVPTDPACDTIYRAADGGSAFTSLLSFDLTSSDAPTTRTIISRPGAVYASPETLYLAVPQSQSAGQQPWFEELAQEKEASTVHGFRIGTDPRSTTYLGSGIVKGRVLNQFSMDEYQSSLRIATTSGHLPSPDAHNTLSVLRWSDGGLRLRGQIDNIAPGEDIRSVRFDGERGFIVTFKKTDPLFTFDLAKPEEPKLLGELMIPGFSTYIHLLDDKHLLTIGYDAVDHGDFAFFDGVILQIFDISDPKAPKLAHKASIGTRGSSSEALADHLAFTLFQGKLALPMTICEGGGDGAYGTDMTFSGLIVYDVSIDKGFSERGRVANPPSNGQYNDSLCQNWWTNASSEIKRSIFMDDFVYALSPDVVHVQDTRSLGQDIATVKF